MRLVFDLDGVIRDIQSEVERAGSITIKEWNVNINGMDFCTFISNNPEILFSSPPTKYLAFIKKKIPRVEIWTACREDWKHYTRMWLNKYIGEKNYICYFKEPHQKLDTLNAIIKRGEQCMLIEDHPNIYLLCKTLEMEHLIPHIYLVNRRYNKKQQIPGQIIKTIDDLETLWRC